VRLLAERRALWLWAAGAVAGLALAGAGVIGAPQRWSASGEVAALVNGTPISSAELDRALRALAAERREVLGPEERAHVLDRMIEEELLIQRGVEIGLLRSDRSVRAALVASMIDAAIAEASSAEPDEGELREFYSANEGYFARPGRLEVRQIFFRASSDALERAEGAWRRLEAGEAFEVVRESGDPDLSGLPQTPLPAAKLRDYLGPSLSSAAAGLEVGGFSRPLTSSSGVHLLELVAAEPGGPAPFAEVREQVAAELRRRAGERALREYLDSLRAAADVELNGVQSAR